MNKAILVTGAHRSGSTWIGKLLATAPGVGYIHEPFNIDPFWATNHKPFQHWFTYVCLQNESEYLERIQTVLDFNYPLLKKVHTLRSPRQVAKVCRDQTLFLIHKVMHARPLMKDPIALFSAEWLRNRFMMDVVVAIRHPAAFCASLKVQQWAFPFEHFLRQPLLMEHLLGSYQEEIMYQVNNPGDVLDQAILLWNCFHSVILQYKEKKSEWHFVRHEDLSSDPITGFKNLYDQLNLEYSEKCEEAIIRLSGGHRGRNGFYRNSSANIWSWKRRLSREDIVRIRKGTEDLADYFYNSDEW